MALGAACSETPAAEPTASPRSLPTESPSPTPSPTPSPSPTEVEPPAIDLTAESEEDFERVVQEILTFRDWLFAHPAQSDLVSTIYWPTCFCHDEFAETLDQLVDFDQRLVGEAANLHTLNVDEFDIDAGTARLLVVWHSGRAQQVDAEGNVVHDEEGQALDQIWLMGRNEEGRWRVDDVVARP